MAMNPLLWASASIHSWGWGCWGSRWITFIKQLFSLLFNCCMCEYLERLGLLYRLGKPAPSAATAVTMEHQVLLWWPGSLVHLQCPWVPDRIMLCFFYFIRESCFSYVCLTKIKPLFTSQNSTNKTICCPWSLEKFNFYLKRQKAQSWIFLFNSSDLKTHLINFSSVGFHLLTIEDLFFYAMSFFALVGLKQLFKILSLVSRLNSATEYSNSCTKWSRWFMSKWHLSTLPQEVNEETKQSKQDEVHPLHCHIL